MLKGWQGNPAQRMSCAGIFFEEILVMSPCGSILKFSLYTLHASLSISDANTHFAPKEDNAK